MTQPSDKEIEEIRTLFKKHAHYDHSGGFTTCTSFDQQELDYLIRDLYQAQKAAVADAEYKLLDEMAQKANKQYTWQEVDNWIFAFGSYCRERYIMYLKLNQEGGQNRE